MSVAKQCDRCENFYEPYTTKVTSKDVNGISLIKRRSYDISFSNEATLDLCPQCIHELNKWLTEDSNNESISE